jgi:glucans biosynthesis protein
MTDLDRRTFVATLTGLGLTSGSSGAVAQQSNPPSSNAPPNQPKFNFDEVVRRARDLSTTPLMPPAPLPDPLAKLDYDAWRDIRFRPERALLGNAGGDFRLQLFHLGHVFRQPVTVNIIRDGLAAPVPYAPNLFDYGRTKLDKPLPLNLGFAGFRLHYPLNDPQVFDELISFLGASYFRLLGRGQRYGLAARALAVNAGSETEDYPFFREFWIDTPAGNADRVTIYALLDGESVTGAYRFELWPGVNSVMEVASTLFLRRAGAKFGLAPLTSMFFIGENDRRVQTDYRPELHDSDGLLIHSGTGEWLWRPLRNPGQTEFSAFLETNVRGFGLMQRDRTFAHYQDLDANYELRPSYWIEPLGQWGEGNIELIEMPTGDESMDNIVASWVPKAPLETGKPVTFGYRITAGLQMPRLSPNAQVVNTYQTPARSLGSSEQPPPNSRRFIVDFAGGDLSYFQAEPKSVEVVPSATNGKIIGSFITPNPHTKGFRVGIDVQVESGQTADLRAFLKSGSRALTETWTVPWKAP